MISQRLPAALLLIGALGYFSIASPKVQPTETASQMDSLLINMPLPLQLALTMGDQYLAANIDFFRAQMKAVTPMPEQSMKVYSQLLYDTVKLNPYHEDGYYLSAATVPWKPGGNLELAQQTLKAATYARSWDWMPPFYYAFNASYFLKNSAEAAAYYRIAAPRHARNTAFLTLLAAKSEIASASPTMAAQTLRLMAENSQNRKIRLYLEGKAQQLDAVAHLEEKTLAFKNKTGAWPKSWQDMVDQKLLETPPQKMFGNDFELKDNGKVSITNSKAKAAK